MKYLGGFVFGLVALFLVAMVVVMPVIGSFISWSVFDYSEGSRTGLVNKISNKGVVCKTWEGYILVGNGQNVQPEQFDFTVKDDAIAHQIEALSGKVVTLTYKQYLFASPCWGNTNYEVTAVTVQ